MSCKPFCPKGSQSSGTHPPPLAADFDLIVVFFFSPEGVCVCVHYSTLAHAGGIKHKRGGEDGVQQATETLRGDSPIWKLHSLGPEHTSVNKGQEGRKPPSG